jgi:hypothetical protein
MTIHSASTYASRCSAFLALVLLAGVRVMFFIGSGSRRATPISSQPFKANDTTRAPVALGRLRRTNFLAFERSHATSAKLLAERL